MKLYLVQCVEHSYAGGADSEQGQKAPRRVAEKLKNLGVSVEQIQYVEDPLAEKTAKEIADIVAGGKVNGMPASVKPEKSEDNAPGNKREAMYKHVETLTKWANGLNKDTIIVEEQEVAQTLASALATGDPKKTIVVSYEHSGVVCLEKGNENWNVKWFLWPSLMSQPLPI